MISFTIVNKNRPKATVIMIVSLFGKQYHKSIGVGLPPKYWNSSKHRARATAEFDGNPVNDAIDRWEEIGKKTVKYFSDAMLSPSKEEFAAKIAEFSSVTNSDDIQNSQYLADYLESVYIPRYQYVRGIDTVKIYRVVLNKLRAFEAYARYRVKFEHVNIDFYNRFQSWFFNQGFSRNYFGNIMKVIKQVYKEARDNDHLHDGTGTDHRDFVCPNDTADSIYLSPAELDRIHSLKIDETTVQDPEHPISGDWLDKRIKALTRARNLFLIGCYTGLRVSDFSRLSEAHIGKFITIKTHKTGTPVVIPIHPIVREIIDSGFDLSDSVSDQKLNAHIKSLCRMAGIDEEVLVNKNVGGRNTEVVLPKYQLVSSHTARRSFATNAYKAGVPTIAIMKITGHKLESTFLKYIRVSAEENAELLSNHPFFNQHSGYKESI